MFPVLGAAAWGGAVWWWSGWWFGPGVARRAVRLSAPLRHQIALAAGLIAAGVALLATGIELPLVWTLTTLALISWGLAGPFTLADRARSTQSGQQATIPAALGWLHPDRAAGHCPGRR